MTIQLSHSASKLPIGLYSLSHQGGTIPGGWGGAPLGSVANCAGTVHMPAKVYIAVRGSGSGGIAAILRGVRDDGESHEVRELDFRRSNPR